MARMMEQLEMQTVSQEQQKAHTRAEAEQEETSFSQLG